MYIVNAPSTPGAKPVEQFKGSLKACRDFANEFAKSWMTYQDIRVDTSSGKLKEYAGPAR